MILTCARVVISQTSAAIKTGGLAGEAIKVQLDIYPDSAEEILAILNLRGKEMAVVFSTVDEKQKAG